MPKGQGLNYSFLCSQEKTKLSEIINRLQHQEWLHYRHHEIPKSKNQI